MAKLVTLSDLVKRGTGYRRNRLSDSTTFPPSAFGLKLCCGISHRGDFCGGDQATRVHQQPCQISSNGGLDIRNSAFFPRFSAFSHALEPLGCGISHRGDICREDRIAQVHLQPCRIWSNGGLDIAETVLYSDLVFVRDLFRGGGDRGNLDRGLLGFVMSFVTVGISAEVGPFGLGLPTMTLVAGLQTDLLPDYKDVWCDFPTRAMEFPRSHDLPLGPLG